MKRSSRQHNTFQEDIAMHPLQRDTDAQVQPFSGHAFLYTVYRHHYGLTHEQAVQRMGEERQRVLAVCSREENTLRTA